MMSPEEKEQFNNLVFLVAGLKRELDEMKQKEGNQIVGYLPKGANFILSKRLKGTLVAYVSDTSGGTVDRKLTFEDGILTNNE